MVPNERSGDLRKLDFRQFIKCCNLCGWRGMPEKSCCRECGRPFVADEKAPAEAKAA